MASIIDPVLAKSLIKEYQQQNGTAGGPGLLTPDKKFLNGFLLDRQSLEVLLSNPSVVGVHVHFAKHHDFAGSPENVFTVLTSGAEINTANVAGATPYVNRGVIYNDPPPCPPECSDVGN